MLRTLRLTLLSFGAVCAIAATTLIYAQTNGSTNGKTWNDTRHDVSVFSAPAVVLGTLTTAAATAPYYALASVHGVYVIVTGGPSGCTGRLQGSADGTNFFDLDAADETCTSSEATFLVDKPATWVRWNQKTLTGGTAPTVKVSYAGR